MRNGSDVHIRSVIFGGYDLLALLGTVVAEIADYEYELSSLIGRPLVSKSEE